MVEVTFFLTNGVAAPHRETKPTRKRSFRKETFPKTLNFGNEREMHSVLNRLSLRYSGYRPSFSSNSSTVSPSWTRDAFEDAGEGSAFDWVMVGDYLMVFPILLGGHADMGAFLSIRRVSEDAQSFDQLCPVDIARNFHRARTSSRTKWRRIILGASIVSSK